AERALAQAEDRLNAARRTDQKASEALVEAEAKAGGIIAAAEERASHTTRDLEQRKIRQQEEHDARMAAVLEAETSVADLKAAAVEARREADEALASARTTAAGIEQEAGEALAGAQEQADEIIRTAEQRAVALGEA